MRRERHRHAGHAHHLLEPLERVARRVGVNRRHRPFVAGVHRLQHVERLFAAALADDDAIRPHAQRVAHEIALANLALALDVGRAGLQAADMRLLQLQFRRVLDGDEALAVRNVVATARSSSVVLPLPVPPVMIAETLPSTAAARTSTIAGRKRADRRRAAPY